SPFALRHPTSTLFPYTTLFRSLRSAVAAGDIVPGPLLVRIGENLAGLPELDQLAQVEEGRTLRNACRLLHVVRDDHDRETLAQLDRKSTRLNSSHQIISYAVFC